MSVHIIQQLVARLQCERERNWRGYICDHVQVVNPVCEGNAVEDQVTMISSHSGMQNHESLVLLPRVLESLRVVLHGLAAGGETTLKMSTRPQRQSHCASWKQQVAHRPMSTRAGYSWGG